MYCTKCGAKLDDNVLFCENCGNKAEQQTNAAKDMRSSYENFMSRPKSKVVAGILAILLGSMGIHEFYLGYTRKGITHLMMFVFYLGWISQIWAVCEALMILTGKLDTDGRGIPLSS